MTTWNSIVMGINDWWNSERGRRVVKWGTTAFGVLVANGQIPLDMAIGPFSLGQLLTIFGLAIPSAPPQAKDTTPLAPALRVP